MSVRRVAYLFCDGPRCGHSWGEEIDPGPLAQQRREARDVGWKTSQPGGTDYCSQECYDDAAGGRS